MERLANLALTLEKSDTKMGESIKNKEQWFKNNGWGFKDTEFHLDDDGSVQITGSRYEFSGQKMPKFKDWAENVVGIDINNVTEAQRDIPVDPPVENLAFVEALKGKVDEITSAKATRIFHSHGHSLQ
jgi:alkyldihydroxyacetonephosphate synthase